MFGQVVKRSAAKRAIDAMGLIAMTDFEKSQGKKEISNIWEFCALENEEGDRIAGDWSGCLAAGALDMTAAFITFGVGVPRAIASGLLGWAAFQGGVAHIFWASFCISL
jgi:hypothetical protein